MASQRFMTAVLIAIALSVSAPTVRESRAEDDEKEAGKKGTVVGVVTEKGKDFIAVKADGEEKARRYVPHFPGKPKGTDKATLDLMRKIPIGARVRLEWLYAERHRVMRIELLK